MEDTATELALINELSTTPVTKELITSPGFSQKYEYLLGMIKYLGEIKAAVDEGLKSVAKENYLATGESSVVSSDYRFTYVPETTRESFDSKALKEADPDTYSKFVKIGSVKETFRVTKIKKEAKGE